MSGSSGSTSGLPSLGPRGGGWVAIQFALCWALKARVEERFLAARFPAYAAYLERTPRRFLPYVW